MVEDLRRRRLPSSGASSPTRRQPGRPSTPAEAGAFIVALTHEGGAQIWQPGVGFAARLQALAVELDVKGTRIFDLQIALTAFDNGVVELWSHDRNFIAFPGIQIPDPIA
ncbi:MAG: hypothetical protein IH936_14620 [Acidobacteria bacterium]|nr:hypothetical protein [Acidobacteriota bacterium]